MCKYDSAFFYLLDRCRERPRTWTIMLLISYSDFPNKSSPNTSPCISPDTSPCPKTSSCAGGTLSARAALRLNKNPAHISSCFSNPFTYQTYTRRIYPCISISFFARRIYFSCFYTFYSMLKCSCSSYFIFF